MHDKDKNKILNKLKNDKIFKGLISATPSEINIIFKLMEKPKTVKELAKELQFDESTIYKSVGRLYKLKLLKRIKIQNGGKKMYIYYLEKEALINFMRERVDYWCSIIDSFKLKR